VMSDPSKLKKIVEVNFPFAESFDKECQNVDVRFAEVGSLPMMALVSFPGSGNSWLRLLIEAATGIFTGSFYNDNLLQSYLLGENRFDDGTTILQKTHHYSLDKTDFVNKDFEGRITHMKYFNKKGILLIRDPYRAILSYFQLLQTSEHTGTINKESFKYSKFRKFVKNAIKSWYQIIEDWVLHADMCHIVYFEDILSSTKEELKKIVEILGLNVDEKRLKCLEHNQQNKLKRKKLERDFNPFRGELAELIDSYIDKANVLVKKINSEGLPLKKYPIYKISEELRKPKTFMRGAKVNCDVEEKKSIST